MESSCASPSATTSSLTLTFPASGNGLIQWTLAIGFAKDSSGPKAVATIDSLSVTVANGMLSA